MLDFGFPNPSFKDDSSHLILSDLAVRLQTHTGDNVPCGLFQDAAMTTPATQDGHRIGGWRDMWDNSISPFAVIQSDNSKRPTLTFIDGIPHIYFAAGQYLVGSKARWDLKHALVVCSFSQDDIPTFTLFDIGHSGDSWNQYTAGMGYPCVFCTVRKDAFHTAFTPDPFVPHTLTYYSANGLFEAYVDGSLEATTNTNTFANDSVSVVIGNSYALGATSAKNFVGTISSFFVSHKYSDRQPLELYANTLI